MAGPASSGFDRVPDPAAPIPLAAQAAHREARQGLLQKALSHALGGPSPERLGGAGSRARQPPRPLSAGRPVGAGSRSTPGIVPAGSSHARSPGPVFVLAARACSRPRAVPARATYLRGPGCTSEAGARRRAVGRAEASGKG